MFYKDEGSHLEYDLNTEGSGYLEYWPPSGWVIEFKNDLVSTTERRFTENISLFPNPVSNVLNIDHGLKNNNSKIEIYNSGGKMMMQDQLINSVDVSLLPAGIYYLKIISNESVITEKFIKI